MDELAFSDAVTLAARIAKREIGALELLDHYLERVERYNPDINAVICMQADEARDRARDADAATLRGVSWGPLHGVPMTVKESYDLAGLPSTWGIPNLKDNVADTDAVSCQRLQSAGAIIFGKTNVPLNLADIQRYH